MTYKEDKPTYFRDCEHLLLDNKILRNSMYRKRIKSGAYLASFEMLKPIQKDMTRSSKGSGTITFNNFYLAECPICLKEKENGN